MMIFKEFMLIIENVGSKRKLKCIDFFDYINFPAKYPLAKDHWRL